MTVPGEWSRLRMPFAPGASVIARRELEESLTQQHVSEPHRGAAAIVLHELITNTLDHGAPDADGEIEARWSVSAGQLLLAVHDEGSDGVVDVRRPSPDDPTGRGLALVDAMSVFWSVDRSHGTWVTACLPLDD